MLEFDPRFTEVVYFDLEFYVPPHSRQQGSSSLIFNPAKEDNIVLGGVFCREFPLLNKKEQPRHIWHWKQDEEETTLREIYNYFGESWQMIEGKRPNHPDLIAVGTGISRVDIPALYVRSTLHKIDSEPALYDRYFKTKAVDLTDVGIAMFRPNPNVYAMYPKTANALVSRLKISSRKASGKSVWDLYDSRDFEAIKMRTASEVEDIIQIASKIVAGQM